MEREGWKGSQRAREARKGGPKVAVSYKRHQHSCNSSSKTDEQDSTIDSAKTLRELAKKG